MGIDIHQVGNQFAVFIFGIADTETDGAAFHEANSGHLGFAGCGPGP
jgi:hypothetical protein